MSNNIESLHGNNSINQIYAHTSFVGNTGYNHHARDFFTNLNKFIPVKVRNFTAGSSWKGITENTHGGEKYLTKEQKKMMIQQTVMDGRNRFDYNIYDGKKSLTNNYINIVLNETNHYYFYDRYDGIKIAYNVWESTRQPEQFFNRLLEFDYLWVPSEWQKQCSIDQGYPADRIYVVPEAVNGDIFFPEKDKSLDEYKDGRFKFILFGRCDYRKSTIEIIRTFLSTFLKDEPVDLVVSIDNPYSGDGIKTTEERLKFHGLNDDRVKVKHFPSREDYIKYLKSGDVFISCARSEGWNIPLIESMACGTPSIYSNWGAQLEFAGNKGLSVKIVGEKLASASKDSDYELFGGDFPGNYCEPDFNDLAKVMRYSYDNYDECKNIAIEDSKEIRNKFSWGNVAEKAYRYLEDIRLGGIEEKSISFNSYYNSDHNRIYIDYYGNISKKATIYIKDVSSNLLMYKFDADLPVRQKEQFWAIPFDTNFKELSNFRGFIIDVIDYDGNKIYTNDIIVEDCEPIDDFKFFNSYIDPTWVNYYEMFYDKIYDDFINIVAGDTVVDIGANRGIFTRYALKNGAGKCYSIEPVEPIYDEMIETFKEDDRVVPLNIAIGKNSGVSKICIPDNGAYSVSSFYIDGAKSVDDDDNYRKYSEIEVRTLSFNDLVKENKIKNIGLLKVDTEGAEYDIFESMDENYLKDNIRQVILEFHFNDGKVKRIMEKLNRCGFSTKITGQNSSNNGSLESHNGIIFATKTEPDIIEMKVKLDSKYVTRFDFIPRNIIDDIYRVEIVDEKTSLIFYSSFLLLKNGCNFWVLSDSKFSKGLVFNIYDKENNLLYSYLHKCDNYYIHDGVGHKLYSHPNDEAWIQYEEIVYKEDYRMGACKIEDGDICLDIGSNNGFFSLYAVKKGASKVYSVEPVQRTYDYLVKNINIKEEYIDKIYPIKCAISDKTGKGNMIVYDRLSAQNKLTDNVNNGNMIEEVNLIEINSFLDQNNIEKVDFLKIDAEESEYEIMKAIDDDFLANSIKKIVIEFHSIDSRVDEFNDIRDKIERCGFEFSYNRDEGNLMMFYAWKSNYKKNNSILMVNLPGDIPHWFDYLMRSCKKNDSYDWLIFSECDAPSDIPSNVEFISTKIKNFEPSILDLYDRYFHRYDYFGFFDSDIIFGDLWKCCEFYQEEKYDVIILKDYCFLIKNDKSILSKEFFEDKYSNFDKSLWKKYVDDSVKTQELLEISNFKNGAKDESFSWEDGKLCLPNGEEIFIYNSCSKCNFHNSEKGFLINNDFSNLKKRILNAEKLYKEKSNRDILETIKNEVYKKKIYEKYFSIDNGDIVVDFGAHVGWFELSFMDKHIDKCYCVEPDNFNFSDLSNNIKKFDNSDNFILINKAIDSKTGESLFSFEVGFGITGKSNGGKAVKCSTISFADFVSDNNIVDIDFLKLDCEGGEYDIFDDENNFDYIRDHIKKIAGEIHLRGDKKDALKLVDNLKSLGFNIKINSVDGIDITNGFYDNFDYYTEVLVFAIKDKFNNSFVNDSKLNNNKKGRDIKVHFIDGPFLEIKGNNNEEYDVEFIDKKTSDIVHSGTINTNNWIRANRKWYTDWSINVYNSGELIFNSDFHLQGKRVLISMDTRSLGDTLAWIPYVEEFRKKHKCKVFCSTFWNNLFEKKYVDIKFILPGTTINNIYASYSSGWYYPFEEIKNPIDFREIPLQQTISDILGLKYKEIKPKITIPDKPRNIEGKYVCIGVHSTAQCKYWNYQGGWQEITDYLKERDYKVVLIHKEQGTYMGNTSPKGVIDKSGKLPIEDRIIDLKYADMFLGISSGLSWLSWAVGIPTVVVSGATKPFCEFSTNIHRIHNNTVCNGCLSDRNIVFDKGDWNWCPRGKDFECSKNISPEMVKVGINLILREKYGEF